MSDPTTPSELIAQLRQAAVLCGVDEELFAADYLHKAADALAEMCVDLAVTTAYAERAKEIITSVQAELLAGGSLARLRAIVGIIPPLAPSDPIRELAKAKAAAQAVLDCFERGEFVRNTDGDGCADWASRAIRPLAALAKLKDIVGLTPKEASTNAERS